MQKTPTVLVPIDFSRASGAGLRFALQWASQQKIALVCLHVVNILRPTSWSDARYRKFANAEKQRHFQQLRAYVDSICKRAAGPAPDIALVLVEALSPDIALGQYCRRRKDIDYICMGTKGAGGLKQLFGTHTGNVIRHAGTPVIAVPESYRRQPIRRILYGSDLADYAPEVRRLIEFAEPLKAKLRALHISYLGEPWRDEETLSALFKKQFRYPLDVSIVHAEPNLSVARNLQRQIVAFKPSMVVLFTQHRPSALQKLLYPSVAERISFRPKTPLLVFPKPGRQAAARRRRGASAAANR
ncbi:MAG TPA: universal stress protein [Puia sp.]|nr:universal stress protein [Puia sp.]